MIQAIVFLEISVEKLETDSLSKSTYGSPQLSVRWGCSLQGRREFLHVYSHRNNAISRAYLLRSYYVLSPSCNGKFDAFRLCYTCY